MTNVNAIAAAGMTTTGAAAQQQRAPKQEMDGDLFMKLLITQLGNQDPSNPMDSSQMIQQTAQLAQMEKLNSLADLTSESFALQMRTAAAQLIGTEVSYVNADGTTGTGTVSAIRFDGPIPTVNVDGNDILLTQISSIG